ncbi:hypothetical protein P7K49_037025, partial [Saguinus oedipus]
PGRRSCCGTTDLKGCSGHRVPLAPRLPALLSPAPMLHPPVPPAPAGFTKTS